MTTLLEAAQKEAYARIAPVGTGRAFLRLAKQDHCLWVSDLPRWETAEAQASAAKALTQNGFFFAMDSSANLLEIDLSLPRYAALLAPLPTAPPAFLPDRDAAHPAYALCRLLLSRPCPLEVQPLAPLRSLLKAAATPNPRRIHRLIPALHEECARWLREKEPLPHAAGRVLADWLVKGEYL